MMKKHFLVYLGLLCYSISGFAWIYPEHRDIMLLSIQKLDPAHRAALDRFWSLARTGHETRLFPLPIDTVQGEKPEFIDYAAWPAISGDHSTSSANLLHNVLETSWILKVADVAAELKIGIANSTSRSERINKLRDSDLKLFRVDPEYVTRAGSNSVHFMLARPEVNTTAAQYFAACIRKHNDLNALGTYGWFHLSALLKAQKFAHDSMSTEQRSALILAALADEAFAIHFLEDMFASGHVAGTWGNASQRKGTHDYYNESGLEVTTWGGERIILMGDAYMRPEDAERTSIPVLKSLIEILDAASGTSTTILKTSENLTAGADTFNICKNNFMPPRPFDTAVKGMLRGILAATPVPGLATGLGELPRFRSEVGPFIGLTAAVRGAVLSNGFGTYQLTAGFIPSLEMAFRVGLGLEGVLNEAGDGLVFLDIGWRQDGNSSMKFAGDPTLKQFGSIFSAIPGRDAFYLRLRLPFFIIPGDLLIIAPFLYLFAPEAATKMVTTAGNGGLLPWQAGIITSIGRFQFVLGREVGAYVYGFPQNPDRLILPYDGNDPPDEVLISMRSIQLEFPVLEYRPFHNFSTDQTASLVFQVFGGLDIPGKATVITPENTPAPKTRIIWNVGLRIAFDWRYYFSKKKRS